MLVSDQRALIGESSEQADGTVTVRDQLLEPGKGACTFVSVHIVADKAMLACSAIASGATHPVLDPVRLGEKSRQRSQAHVALICSDQSVAVEFLTGSNIGQQMVGVAELSNQIAGEEGPALSIVFDFPLAGAVFAMDVVQMGEAVENFLPTHIELDPGSVSRHGQEFELGLGAIQAAPREGW